MNFLLLNNFKKTLLLTIPAIWFVERRLNWGTNYKRIMKLLLFIRSCYVYVNIAIGKICHYLVLKKQRKIILKKPTYTVFIGRFKFWEYNKKMIYVKQIILQSVIFLRLSFYSFTFYSFTDYEGCALRATYSNQFVRVSVRDDLFRAYLVSNWPNLGHTASKRKELIPALNWVKGVHWP